MKRWIDGYIDRCRDGNRWIDGYIDRWKDGYMNRWKYGYIDRWRDGYMNRWIDGYIDRFIHKSIYLKQVLRGDIGVSSDGYRAAYYAKEGKKNCKTV